MGDIRSLEDAELADILDRMKNPDARTLNRILNAARGGEIEACLRDRKNRRAIPYRLEQSDMSRFPLASVPSSAKGHDDAIPF